MMTTVAVNGSAAQEGAGLSRSGIVLNGDTLTPEALWAMGRIGSCCASPDGTMIAYQVGYYSVAENRSQQTIRVIGADGQGDTLLTTGAKSETDPAWTDNDHIAFLSDGDLWVMRRDGTDRKRLTHSEDVEGFMFAPDGTKVLLIKRVPYHEIIKANPDDLPKATGRLITDLMYRHWDHYVETVPHPFIAAVDGDSVADAKDILDGEPYECPIEPFGGIEQIDWSPDSRTVAYTCKKKTGKDYTVSTDADIYLYDVATGKTVNICKPVDYVAPDVDLTHTMKDQSVNSDANIANNPGQDTNPTFSPDGKRIAWQSMARDGYESDRNRLCVYDMATGTKSYVTDSIDSNVDAYCWNPDGKTIYFTAVWHGTENIYSTDLDGNVRQLTDDCADYVSVAWANDAARLLVTRQSMSAPTDIYSLNVKTKKVDAVTHENKHILDQLTFGVVRQRWIKTTDGKDMMCWIILPPHFDESKKYPTLLYCEGGPQSPLSQFWSYRWNFQIMAANGYVIVAPCRHGMPGYGSAWNEQISGDWTGQCIDDYLTAIDDAVLNLPYVDGDRLGAVGASFGGYSVYALAGRHDGRFKCFIAHDGAFNLEAMYTDTEEAWFSNWEYEDAYWNKALTAAAKRTYELSPHKLVDNWDTPILCIHGEKDYRINYNQGMGAFNAARMKGIPAELLLFPDENHWVLSPQNGILWQRTFFDWLGRWLK